MTSSGLRQTVPAHLSRPVVGDRCRATVSRRRVDTDTAAERWPRPDAPDVAVIERHMLCVESLAYLARERAA